ncbi:hypothetical protein EDB83DRAFT_2341012 [Lactarius deliciosus]|nr:hypothetical protein EDB83DRAFT_2341012 [Lactarius deliciosus]
MNAVASPSSRAVQLQSSPHPTPPWEFTRRKRWADLIVTELSEAIVLVLSPGRKVLYCNPSVREMLGWLDDDLVDMDFTELVNVNDRLSFCTAFARSVESFNELHVYVRLRCNSDSSFAHLAMAPPPPAKEVLLEVMGYPYFTPGDNACQCIFAVAKSYPSRNSAMMNALIELKVENERLQQHIRALRTQELSVTPSAQHMGPYPSDDMSAQLAANLGFPPRPTLGGDPSRSYYASIPHGYEAGTFPPITVLEDDGDAEPRRKKLKKSFGGGDPYICNTCGRTDSPEWRKGPRGPKTLCNACGLRWAKKVRKFEEAAEAGDTSQVPLDDTVPP